MKEVRVFPDVETLAAHCAEELLGILVKRPTGRLPLIAVTAGGTAEICLGHLARRVAERGISLDGVLWVPAEESWPIPEGGGGTARTIRAAVLDALGAEGGAVLNWPEGCATARVAARRFSEEIGEAAEIRPPLLVVLDAAASSLFRADAGRSARESEGMAVAWRRPGGFGLALGPRFLEAARHGILLASGGPAAARNLAEGCPAARIGGGRGILLATEDAVERPAPDLRPGTRMARRSGTWTEASPNSRRACTSTCTASTG